MRPDSAGKRRIAHQLVTETDATNASMPERDIVSTSESAMTTAAAPRISTRLASAEDNQRTRCRQSEPILAIARATLAQSNPNVTGSAISIHPAKWFLLTNGPNGLPFISGVQNP